MGGKTAVLSIWRPRFSVNDAGAEELEAEQTITNQVYSFTKSILCVLTITRYSVTKMATRITTHKQVYVFNLKTLPLKW
jgi:hypothetical protein